MTMTEDNIIKNTISHSELSNKGDAYKISHAQKGKSGFSVGATQVDLSKQKKAKDTFVKEIQVANSILANKEQHFSETDLKNLKDNIGIANNKNALPNSLKEKINASLKTDAGKQLVDKLDTDQYEAVKSQIANLRKGAALNNNLTKESKDFINSSSFTVLAADNINQFGSPNKLNALISGKESYSTKVIDPATQKTTTKTVNFSNPLNKKNSKFEFDDFAKYESEYRYIYGDKEGAKDVKRRRGGNLDFIEKNKLDTLEKLAKYRNIVNNNYWFQGKAESNGHYVKSGDTFSSIAKKSGLSVAELQKLNPEIKDINKIKTKKDDVKTASITSEQPTKTTSEASNATNPLGKIMPTNNSEQAKTDDVSGQITQTKLATTLPHKQVMFQAIKLPREII